MWKMENKNSKGIMNILVMVVFFVVVFLIGKYLEIKVGGGAKVPVLDYEYLKDSFYLVAIIAVLTIVREVVKMVASSNPKLTMIVTDVVNIISAVLYVIWLNDDKIKSQAFMNEMNQSLADHQFSLSVITHAGTIYACFIVLGLVVDMISVTSKALKAE